MESAEQIRFAAAAARADVSPADILERVGLYRHRRQMNSLRFEELQAMADDLSAYGEDPVSYVCGLFKKHQVVFVGHHLPTQRTGQFLQELVRALPNHGVHHVAMEYLCRDDQQLIDAITGAGTGASIGAGIRAGGEAGAGSEARAGGGAFAEGLAREVMMRWGLRHGFAFREYLDLLTVAWELNQPDKSASHMQSGHMQSGQMQSGQMRVLGLDYELDFDAVTETADLRSEPPWMHLRHRGTAARHMSDVLQSEILDQGHKALVLCRTPHALTRRQRVPHRVWDAFDTEVEAGRVVGAANHLYAAVADKVATVLIHQPMPADGILCEYALPADGILDAVFAMIDAPPIPLGFDTDVGAVAELQCLSGLDVGPLSDLAQGWIYLEADQQRVAPTPLLGAVSDSVLARARRLALAAELRKPDVTPADFDRAFTATAAAAELSWTQIL